MWLKQNCDQGDSISFGGYEYPRSQKEIMFNGKAYPLRWVHTNEYGLQPSSSDTFDSILGKALNENGEFFDEELFNAIEKVGLEDNVPIPEGVPDEATLFLLGQLHLFVPDWVIIMADRGDLDLDRFVDNKDWTFEDVALHHQDVIQNPDTCQDQIKTYVVQAKCDDGIYISICSTEEIIRHIDMQDCSGEELAVFASDTFGKLESLKIHGTWHDPKNPLYIKVTRPDGTVEFDGYGTDH